MVPSRERIVRFMAVALAAVAAVGAVLASDDLEITFLMLAAVVAALVCFDTSMDRRVQAFAPWALLSVGPIAKTVPTVWLELNVDAGLLADRYEHIGSLLFGISVLAAVMVLGRPGERIRTAVRLLDFVVIVLAAATTAIAGATVGFLYDPGFGTTFAARLIETPTWFVIGGLLSAATIAMGRVAAPTTSLTIVLTVAIATAVMLGVTVAGATIQTGWWAVLFGGLVIASASGGSLGTRDQRARPSNGTLVVALVTGAVAAVASVSARSDGEAWEPGWVLLAAAAMVMFALALASRPLDQQVREERTRPVVEGPVAAFDDERAARAKARALASLRTAAVRRQQAAERSSTSLPRVPTSRQLDPSLAERSHPFDPEVAERSRKPDPQLAERSRHLDPEVAERSRHLDPQPAERSRTPDPELAGEVSVSGGASAEKEQGQRPVDEGRLSDASFIADVQTAVEVRNAPSAQRHSKAPVDRAHHFDPSTGLLSAAGLQQALSTAFATPRRAGHVTIMLFMVRDLDEIERTHGRLASAAVTRAVADRVRTLMPNGTGARFARAAYGVIFVGDLSNANETTQRLARVLLLLRAPVDGGTLGDKIDVVAGMAQCYEGEDAAHFIVRANEALARAVRTAEPTFVAMP